eukprot:CAMPEP_0204592370 /NCGR_PEP_ID=MMETSP0661-20131031/50901_1 /ASSEMBLY_ACC=CAM_ASM_000606 /TAXON_ID=109239 /ORGANISM="Alexandrium margalefi, Strain AMGDE01CS-322" /LENGTH=106 /DNA_ID=CAMNT_0051602595 /DNA_START=100 /DNA_END=420 /DNA_ORIENTATION=+
MARPVQRCRCKAPAALAAALLLLLLCGSAGPGFFFDRNYTAPTGKSERQAEYARLQAKMEERRAENAAAAARPSDEQMDVGTSANLFAGGVFLVPALLTIASFMSR